MKIKKAVIPAAGLGTRVLPASKAMPKEMLPIVDVPAIQYIVEEAANSGIEDILIITNRGKSIIEDHFDRSVELEERLLASGREAEYEAMVRLSNLANITFIRQIETKGLGHAVLRAKSFVGDEPFAVLYGDDVMISEEPVCAQLCKAYEEYGLGAVGIKPVPTELVQKYCSLQVSELGDRLFKVTDMIEKPTPDKIMSNYSILGRCVLPSKIFDILENTKPGFGSEIQLTDAMRELAVTEGMIGVDYIGTRYDMGNKFGIMQAAIEVGLKHPDIKDNLKEYIKELAKTL